MERAVFDHAVVLDCIVERALLDGARCRIVDRAIEGAVLDGLVVLDLAVERAVFDGAIVLDLAVERAIVDGGVVLDFIVERTVFDHAVVLDRVVERAIHDAARCRIIDRAIEGAVVDGAVVLDCAVEGAVLDDARCPIDDLAVEGAAQNAAVVEHFAVELAARDGRRLAHKDVALHRRTISDGAEIVQPAGLVAARQKQHVAIGRVVFNVLPAVALAGDGAAVGNLRITALHDEVAALGDFLVQHHVLVRHGNGHGRLVVFIGVVAFVDGLAVQAEDLGAGGDGHGGACVGVEVPCRFDRHGSRRFIHLQRVFAVHLEHTAIRYGDAESIIGQPRLAVEYAAEYNALFLRQARREGAAFDHSAAV